MLFFKVKLVTLELEDFKQTEREKAERFVNIFAPNRHIYYFSSSLKLTPEGLTHEKLAIKKSSIEELKNSGKKIIRR